MHEMIITNFFSITVNFGIITTYLKARKKRVIIGEVSLYPKYTYSHVHVLQYEWGEVQGKKVTSFIYAICCY